jgi:hypothetical protein
MGPKLLFLVGIVLAHGVLAAGWMAQEAPKTRKVAVTSCTQLPAEPLHINPQRELLAYVVHQTNSGEVYRP